MSLKLTSNSFKFCFLIFTMSLVYACSSPKVVETTTSKSKGESNTIQFDPVWHNPLQAVSVDSSDFRATHLVLAADSVTSIDLAKQEATKILFDAVDNFAEKMRVQSTSKTEWSASEIIKFRRFVYDYTWEKSMLERNKTAPGEQGFYSWQEVSLNRTLFEEALKTTFGL